MPRRGHGVSDVESTYRSLSSRSSRSSRRKIEHSNLLPYHPEKEISDVIDSFNKQKKTNFFTLFRYATIVDRILIAIGLTFSLLNSLFMVWRIHLLGRLMYCIIVNTRCLHPADARKPELLTMLIDDFFWTTILSFFMETTSSFISNGCLTIAADNQVKTIRLKLFSSLIIKDTSWFDYFVNRYFVKEKSEAITKIRLGIGESLGRCVKDVCAAFLLIALSLLQGLEITLVFLVVLPVGVFSAYMGAAADKKFVRTSQENYASANVFAEEVLSNIKMAKVYEGEWKISLHYHSLLRKFSCKETGWLIVSALCVACVSLGGYTAFWCIIWWVPSEQHFDQFCKANTSEDFVLDNGHLFSRNMSWPWVPKGSAVDTVVPFLTIVNLADRLIEIPKYILDAIEATRLATEIFFIMDIVPRINNPKLPGVTPKCAAIGRIEFVNVGFRYVREPHIWAVRNVSMTMYPGQIIAIVGPSGSGKTTILKLIDRLYDPCEGQILLDGNHIEAMDVNWHRKQMCFILQDPILFNTTVEQNIKCGLKTAKMQDIFEACKTVEMHAYILELPHGYSTIVGHRGNIFNENQKRLICLARALIARPRIILIDDPQPTPNEQFDALLNNILQTLREQATIIVTSPQCSTLVKNAGFIFVMNRGKVVESGTHKKLLNQNSLYHDILRQSLDDVDVGEIRRKFPSQLAAYRYSHNLEQFQAEKEKAEKWLGKPVPTDFLKKAKRGITYEKAEADTVGYGFVGFQRRQSKFILSLSEKQNTLKHTPSSSVTSIIDTTDSHKLRKQLRSKLNKPNNKSVTIVTHTSASLKDKTCRIKSRSYQRDNPDTFSISSEDSFIFWDDYLERLDSWIQRARVVKWMDFFSLILKRQVLPFVAVGILASIFLGVSKPFQEYIIADVLLNVNGKDQRESFLGHSFNLFYFGMACAVVALIQIKRTPTRASFLLRLAVRFHNVAVIAFGIAGNKLCALLRGEIFSTMLQQDMQWYDMPENDIRVLSEILTNDTEGVQKNVMLHCGLIFQSIASIAVATVWAIWFINPLFTVEASILAAATPLLFYATYKDRKRAFSHDETLNDMLAPAKELAFEVVNNVKVVASLNLEKHYIEEYKKHLKRKSWFAYCHQMLIISVADPLRLLLFGVFICCSYPKDMATKNGYQSFNDMIRILWFLIFGAISVAKSFAFLPNSKKTRTTLDKINSILTSKPCIIDVKPDICFLHIEPPTVSLRDVAFQYPVMKEKQVLHGITVEFLPETFVAVVGPHGSGKTTIANLILRLYDPSSGAVCFGNENVTHIGLCSVRKLVSLVEGEDCGLQNMTIEECIAFGENFENLHFTEIVAVAKLTQVHDAIMELPFNYQTKLHDLPHNLQMRALKQRVSLARAILGDPKILILDGFTSATDNNNARLMQEAINNARIGRTLIVLTDKIEPIRNADLIVVMNNGYIAEAGEDSMLMERKGLYYNMYMTQRIKNEHVSVDVSAVGENFEAELPSKAVFNPRKNSVVYTKFLEQYTPAGGGIHFPLQNKQRSTPIKELNREKWDEED